MQYTVQKLAKLAGVSGRTLRYYDEIGLLRPTRVASSGYRIYGVAEVNRLQQILFYRELGLELSAIGSLLDDPAFDAQVALESHLLQLETRRRQLDALIENAQRSIAALKGEKGMTDQEKFDGFKKDLVDENERKYGAEVRKKYGEEAAAASNAKFMNMSKEDYDKMQQLSEEIAEALRQAVAEKNPAGPAAQSAAAKHKEWLGFTWPSYTPEAHIGLGEMYVSDERFAAYYDAIVPGAAEMLRDAIAIFCGKAE